MMSHEADILIVASNDERFAFEIRTKFRHWQVYGLTHPGMLYGRRFRRAYYTEAALSHKNAHMLDYLRNQGEVKHIDDYEDIVIDVQSFADERLVQEIRRSRHPHS